MSRSPEQNMAEGGGRQPIQNVAPRGGRVPDLAQQGMLREFQRDANQPRFNELNHFCCPIV